MNQTAAPLTFQTPVKAIEAETWPVDDVLALFDLPFNELMFKAQQTHREHFPDGDVELATLLSIKTGGCEEDCGYCPQAARYDTGVEAKKMLDVREVLDAAKAARENGATRFCMGAALAASNTSRTSNIFLASTPVSYRAACGQ